MVRVVAGARSPRRFIKATNTIGLPRSQGKTRPDLRFRPGGSRIDQQFARWVMLHVQSNPLPICTRPRVLIKGKRT